MKKPIPVMIVPHLNRPDLLERMIKSIDHPIHTLLIIQNGPDSEMPAIDPSQALHYTGGAVSEIIIVKHKNAGCAGSWNEGIKMLPAPFWFIVANDIQFAPGDLEKMANAAWDGHHDYSAFYGNHGHGTVIITARGIDKVGLYDENIFPAYLEDCDWMRRLHLSGERYVDVPGVQARHGDDKLTGSCTIQSDAVVGQNNARTHANNFTYYKRKWGGMNEQEKFPTPFNDPHWPIWAWRFVSGIRANNQWFIPQKK